MNGRICSVADPTVYFEENPDDPMRPVEKQRVGGEMCMLHPGEDFQCRCTMVMWDPVIDGKYEVKEAPEEEEPKEPEQKPESDPASRELEKANERLAEKEKELETTKAELKSANEELSGEKAAREAAEKATEELTEKAEKNAQVLQRGDIADKIKIVKTDKVLKSVINSTPRDVEKIAEALREDEVLKAGILTEKIATLHAVEKLCERMNDKYPDIIGGNVHVLEFSEKPTETGFIGMKSDHKSRQIYLNTVIPLYYNTENKSPKELLFAAFEDIRYGHKLSFEREYAIESYYHELLHLNAKGWEALPEKSSKRLAMEIMNQFVSRHYYNEFVEAMGGKAVNQIAIKNYGTGYKRYLDDFNNLLEEKKIDPEKIAKNFRKVLLNEKYDSLESYIDKFMKDNFKISFGEFIEISQSK